MKSPFAPPGEVLFRLIQVPSHLVKDLGAILETEKEDWFPHVDSTDRVLEARVLGRNEDQSIVLVSFQPAHGPRPPFLIWDALALHLCHVEKRAEDHLVRFDADSGGTFLAAVSKGRFLFATRAEPDQTAARSKELTAFLNGNGISFEPVTDLRVIHESEISKWPAVRRVQQASSFRPGLGTFIPVSLFLVFFLSLLLFAVSALRTGSLASRIENQDQVILQIQKDLGVRGDGQAIMAFVEGAGRQRALFLGYMKEAEAACGDLVVLRTLKWDRKSVDGLWVSRDRDALFKFRDGMAARIAGLRFGDLEKSADGSFQMSVAIAEGGRDESP